MSMNTGKVKFFNEEKGYGFITPDNGNSMDVFIHITNLRKSGLQSLLKDQRVSFGMEDHRGKTQACDIKLV